MVVVIASNGDVAARVHFDAAVDPGLVEWASSYLNERLAGLGLGSRMIAGRLADPELGPVEAAFVASSAPPSPTLERGRGRRSTSKDRAAALREHHAATCPTPTS